MQNNKEVNLAYLFGICVEKGSELPDNDPNKKYKYRVVFQGNRVVNQDWEAATFEDLGSSPATMESSRACDMFGCAPGHDIEMADAEQAYIQAELKGMPTWVCLPSDERPEAWKHMKRPAVLLKKALYGHPDSGTFWEQHCDQHVCSVGYRPVGPEWPSCYYHDELGLFLVIYVDDFKLAGPTENLQAGWDLIMRPSEVALCSVSTKTSMTLESSSTNNPASTKAMYAKGKGSGAPSDAQAREK